MQRYHANGIGALLLESSHKRDNARPEPVGGINQVVGVEPGSSRLIVRTPAFQCLASWISWLRRMDAAPSERPTSYQRILLVPLPLSSS